jgi:hypothetical protein
MNMNILRKATDAQLIFLRNSGASFKVVLADGEVVVHDPNNLIEPKAKVKGKRSPPRNPGVSRGEPSAYVMPFLKVLEPGQTATIPCKYHIETMRSVVCNHARILWGSKNYMTEFDETRENIVVLRVN